MIQGVLVPNLLLVILRELLPTFNFTASVPDLQNASTVIDVDTALISIGKEDINVDDECVSRGVDKNFRCRKVCAGTKDCFRNAHNQILSSIRCLAQNSGMIVVSDNQSVVCCRLVRFVN